MDWFNGRPHEDVLKKTPPGGRGVSTRTCVELVGFGPHEANARPHGDVLQTPPPPQGEGVCNARPHEDVC